MNKFDFLNNSDIGAYQFHEGKVVGELATHMHNVVKTSKFYNFVPEQNELGAFEYSKALTLEGFAVVLTLKIEDAATGEYVEKENALALVYDCINGVPHVALYWKLNDNNFKLIIIYTVDESGELTKVGKAEDFNVEITAGVKSSLLSTLISAMTSDTVVASEEPSTYKFKKKVPRSEWSNYKTYKFKERTTSAPIELIKINRAKILSAMSTAGDNAELFNNPSVYREVIALTEQSVMYSGLSIDRLRAVDTPADLQHVPFGNFSIVIVDNSGYFILNCLSGKNGMRVAVLYPDDAGKSISVVDGFTISRTGEVCSSIITHKSVRDAHWDKFPALAMDKSIRLTKHHNTALTIRNFLSIALNYDTQKITGRFTRNHAASVTGGEEFIPKNVHLVVDFTKRRQYVGNGEGQHACGYRMPEHSRSGHWRRLPHSEERIFVKGSVINKGLGDTVGRTSKEFDMENV